MIIIGYKKEGKFCDRKGLPVEKGGLSDIGAADDDDRGEEGGVDS